jgi:CubicO group peptidase (beta-lactamase class C family)
MLAFDAERRTSVDPSGVMTEFSMNRREFIAGTSGLMLSPLAGFGQKGPAEAPWFDPSFSELPTKEQQIKGLSAEALAAQDKPRNVNGLPVTGLPHKLGTDEQIASLVKSAGLVGVSFAIAIDHQLMATRGYGHLSSHEKLAALPTSPGYLGSVTKPLCAMAGLTLVKAGKLKLDQKVLDVLPLEPLLKPGERRQPEIDSVTIRMLMNHTSGLFNVVEELFDREYYRKLAEEGKLKLIHGDISQYGLVRRGMAKPFVSKPGREFHYSGQGLQVLGRVIEKLSGQRLDKCMAAKILAPIGVKRHACLSYLSPETRLEIDAGRASKTHTFIPSPYVPAKRVCESWAFKETLEDLYGNHWGQADSCGASMLSAVDLLRFVAFCFKPLGKDLEAEAMTPAMVHDKSGKLITSSQGLGWGVSKNAGRHQYGHGGAWGGIRAFAESTWDGVQYAVLAAGEQDEQFDKIVQHIVELGRSLKKQKATAVGWKQYGFE